MPSKQDQIQHMLENCGLSYYKIKVFGTQIKVEVVNARQWFELLGKIAEIKYTTDITIPRRKGSQDWFKECKGHRIVATLKKPPQVIE